MARPRCASPHVLRTGAALRDLFDNSAAERARALGLQQRQDRTPSSSRPIQHGLGHGPSHTLRPWSARFVHGSPILSTGHRWPHATLAYRHSAPVSASPRARAVNTHAVAADQSRAPDTPAPNATSGLSFTPGVPTMDFEPLTPLGAFISSASRTLVTPSRQGPRQGQRSAEGWSSEGRAALGMAVRRSPRSPPLRRTSAPSPMPASTTVRAGDLDTRLKASHSKYANACA